MATNDKVVGWLRTVVPIAWGYIVAFALSKIPGSEDFLNSLGIDLNGVAVVNVVTGIAAAAWYALWRWLEPRLPAWLTRVVLGSNQAPVYAGTLTEGETAPEVAPEDPAYEESDVIDDYVGDEETDNV